MPAAAEPDVPEGLAIALGIAPGHADRDDRPNKVRSPRRPLAEILTVRGL